MHEIPDIKNPGKTTLAAEKVVAQKGRVQIFGYDLIPVSDRHIRHGQQARILFGASRQIRTLGQLRFDSIRLRHGPCQGRSGGDAAAVSSLPRIVYVDLDERTRRGPGVGLSWRGKQSGISSPDRVLKNFTMNTVSGYVRAYGEDEIQIKTADDVLGVRPAIWNGAFSPRLTDSNAFRLIRICCSWPGAKIDNAGPPSFAIEKHEDDVRGLAVIQIGEHVPIKRVFGVDDVQLDFVYGRESDRDFNLEYFPLNYNRQSQSQALTSARKAGDDYNRSNLLYRTNPQDFDGSWSPRSPFDYGTSQLWLRANRRRPIRRRPKIVGYGHLHVDGRTGRAHAASYFERDIYNQANLDSGRLYGKVDFCPPVSAVLLPERDAAHLGGQGMLYDNSRDGSRTILLEATESTARFNYTGCDQYVRVGSGQRVSTARSAISKMKHWASTVCAISWSRR